MLNLEGKGPDQAALIRTPWLAEGPKNVLLDWSVSFKSLAFCCTANMVVQCRCRGCVLGGLVPVFCFLQRCRPVSLSSWWGKHPTWHHNTPPTSRHQTRKNSHLGLILLLSLMQDWAEWLPWQWSVIGMGLGWDYSGIRTRSQQKIWTFVTWIFTRWNQPALACVPKIPFCKGAICLATN